MGKSKSDDAFFARLGDHLAEQILTRAVPLADVDAALRSHGADPVAIGQRGVELVARLRDEQRLAWQAEARERVERMRAAVTETEAVDDDASEAELEAELARYRRDPTLGGQLETYFSKRIGGTLTVDELRELVTRARQAAALARAKRGGGL